MCLTMCFFIRTIKEIKNRKENKINTEMVRLNITLPSSVAAELDQYSEPRRRSQFITEAIKMRIKQLKNKKMATLLAEGYQATKNEGLEITKEFEPLDIENWDEY